MILSQKNIEEIAAAVTKDFNVFYFGCDSEESRRMARGTPIDQFAREYLGMAVSFARLSSDGSISEAMGVTHHVAGKPRLPQPNRVTPIFVVSIHIYI